MAKKSVAQLREDIVAEAEGCITGAIDLLEGLWQDLDEIKSNLEEKFSETTRYQRLEDLVDALETVKDELESTRDSLPLDMRYS